MIKKVSDIKRPLIKGELLLVPCVVSEMETSYYPFTELYITPVYNHPHADKESGQWMVHYHADYRFVEFSAFHIPVTFCGGKYMFADNPRPDLYSKEVKLEWFVLPVIDPTRFTADTHISNISNVKLKRSCMHNGRCPHKGFNLEQVPPDENGIIKCPMHGLTFDAKTKQAAFTQDNYFHWPLMPAK